MKTQFTTIIAAVALLISTTTLTFANAKTDDGNVTTDLKEIGQIDAIDASGNVEVYLINGDNDAVKVYSDYYAENAVVKNDKGVLRIASYAPEKLIVFVTVSDLQAVTANDNASIRSYGEAFSAKVLNININDKATAQLKLDVIAANITANDEANVQLAGTIENYKLNYSANATINKDNLKSKAGRETQIEQSKSMPTHAMAFGVSAGLLN